jgi:hypothetical protein
MAPAIEPIEGCIKISPFEEFVELYVDKRNIGANIQQNLLFLKLYPEKIASNFKPTYHRCIRGAEWPLVYELRRRIFNSSL